MTAPVMAAASGPVAPAWLVLPLAAVALVATAAHIIALREAPAGSIPESRRRIRVATGWVIMFAVPLSAYAFGIATPARPAQFLTAWVVVTALIGAILILAMLDGLNTVRLQRRAARRLREDFRKLGEVNDDDLP